MNAQPNTYQAQAQATKSRRAAQYAKRSEQKKAMQAYSEACKLARLNGTERPDIRNFWKW